MTRYVLNRVIFVRETKEILELGSVIDVPHGDKIFTAAVVARLVEKGTIEAIPESVKIIDAPNIKPAPVKKAVKKAVKKEKVQSKEAK